tara:strand:+ start:4718 stop:4888 length:171 start_codon:yes stop_codon:yes gene_type:complete
MDLEKEASKEEVQEWQKHLGWLAEKQLSFVTIMSLIQFTMLGLMGLTMFMLGVIFK